MNVSKKLLLNGSFLFSVFLLLNFFSCVDRKETGPVTSGLPAENRFKKTIITEDLLSPVQIKISEAGKIYLIETSGNVKIIDPVTKTVKHAGAIKTYDGLEFGLLGFALDPAFTQNGWVYFQYGLPGKNEDSCIFQVSRFTIQSDSLIISSEKKLITIPYVHSCCHTAGGMTFDSKGNLYFSTGDNTDAFQTVYSPSDERPGHEIANALRSASNSQDLRGKILRIHPEVNGTYTIPGNNLFADKKQGRPEIYIMGCRNAYRMFADKTNDILYWGEVGPDADKDSARGPKGYDEFNIANAAGYYGWPLFIGDNKPYKKIDFATATIGETFNPAKPINYSRLNTGIVNLPPAHKASIWYPYVESTEFAGFGTGGRTAIGGPVYHYDEQLKSSIKFPSYFDKCWFIADWMRNWIKSVHLIENIKVGKIDSLMSGTSFTKPIDMAFGIDGALYMIEYGSNWNDNTDSKLVRIEYISGNRPPFARINANTLEGATPLKLSFSGLQSTDADNDKLTYEWQLNGKKIADSPEFSYTFDKAGKYDVSLTVIDAAGEKNGTSVNLVAGNDKPLVSILLTNKSFYWNKLPYSVEVSDKEDGTLEHGIAAVNVSTSLVKLSHNSILAENGKIVQKGELMIGSSDCKSCHSNNLESIGPSFEKIAGKYAMKENNISKLALKVLNGGNGNWGAKSMAPHPQLKKEQAEEMVRYILSLSAPPDTSQLALKGIVDIGLNNHATASAVYLIRSSYTDRGGVNSEKLSATTSYLLRSATIYPEDFDMLYESSISNNVWYGRHESYVRIRDIDLSNIKQVVINASGKGRIELHLDQPTGQMIGMVEMPASSKKTDLVIDLTATKGFHHVYLVRKSEKARFDGNSLSWISFKN